MKKLFRVHAAQTGIVIFLNEQDEEITKPLYSNTPCEEARRLGCIIGCKVKDVFYSNNLLEYKIEDLIEDFTKKYRFLPENYIDELVSGFPLIPGKNENYKFCYR